MPLAASQPALSADALGLAPAGLPDTIRAAFAPVAGPSQAQEYTRRLTHSHYENFSVISILLPKHLRQDFCNVYAFCRIADDLGDEVPDKTQAAEFLAAFRRQTLDCFDGKAATAVFVALTQTIRRHDIPPQPFLDLISAFQQDQTITRYDSFDQLVDYCRRSADPVGRLVLYMCGYRDPSRQLLSDKTCTALQLANFWQDVRRDILQRDRIYLPADSLQRFGITIDQLRQGAITDSYRALLRFEVDRTQTLFDQGSALLPLLDPKFRRQIALFSNGGQAILQAIRRQNYDTLTRRPSLSKFQKSRLVAGALLSSFTAFLGRREAP